LLLPSNRRRMPTGQLARCIFLATPATVNTPQGSMAIR